MPDVILTEEEQMLQTTIRDFVDREIAPKAKDEKGEFQWDEIWDSPAWESDGDVNAGSSRTPRLDAVVKVTAHRETAMGTSVQSRYYISSLAGQAKTLLEATRPLEHRKQPALDSGRHLSRRPQPRPQGPWSPEPGCPASDSPKFAQERKRSSEAFRVNGLNPDGSRTTS